MDKGKQENYILNQGKRGLSDSEPHLQTEKIRETLGSSERASQLGPNWLGHQVSLRLQQES